MTTRDLYTWLIGSWTLDVIHYRQDLTGKGITGEAHFEGILDGAAIQDVWLCRPCGMHGTTLRVWDPKIEAWRITWNNAAADRRDELIGRKIGADIVQIGAHADGTPIRWIFTEMTPTSFHWIGDALQTDGTTWKREAEFRAQRVGGPPHALLDGA